MTQENVNVERTQGQVPERVVQEEDRPVYLPTADIVAREDAVVLTVDLPGVDPDHLTVSVEDNVLTIRGETAREEQTAYRLLYRDYEPGVFERSFTLAGELEQDRIEAQLKNGVLRLTLPKSEAAKPRRIPVRAEE